MNILFVNYGDFTSNSLNHIGAFANRLTLLGHACAVAVPDRPETISAIHEPLFTPVTFERALAPEPIFPDRRPADIVHAWTPRENVRIATLAYLRHHPSAALVIHLEDNEEFIIESYARRPIAELRQLDDEDLAARLSPRLSHPVRYRNFLRIAHAVTVITDRLAEFVPPGRPVHRLLPGVDAALYQPQIPDPALRASIGLQPNEKVLVYTGSTNFVNLADIRTLLLAVRLINERGTPCKLVRTGINPPELVREIAAIGGDRVIELGFVAKEKLAGLLSLADALVQPGAADAFNDYRLPSKVPEFMCVGRPVITPRANLAREMEDGHHALLLQTGSADEIADQCLRVFGDEALAQRLGDGALAFARTHFDLKANTAGLLAFYEQVRATATPLFTDPATPPSEDVLANEGDTALRMRAKEHTIAAQRARIDQLERELAAAVRERIHVEARASYQATRLQDSGRQLELLRGQFEDATAAVGRLTRELETERARTAATIEEVRLRDEKIKRMTASFSWLATSPLRLLRRVTIDPYRKSATTATAGAMPAVDPFLASSIDQPGRWDDLAPTGTIAGWVLHRPLAGGVPQPIAGVRLRAGSAATEATYRLLRADVAAANGGHPHALHSGFTLDYNLPAGQSVPVVLEALTEDGQWRCFAATTATVSTDAQRSAQQDYAEWVRRFDTPTLEQTIARRARLEALEPLQRPLISILLPTYNTPERWLVRAIESVRAQLYPHWELCIADDASTAPHVRSVLERYARKDTRIKIAWREQNGHISAASNSALALATGEFAALLDHDDELVPHALAEIVFALLAKPALEFIYTDEDKIDEAGRRFAPYFKPDWNPDLLLGQNYTCHLSIFRTARLRAIGGFREGYEGSQDWDLTLRAVEGLDPALIHHIPRVLYHWRAIPGSTALVIDQKSDYPFIAAKKALADHLARTSVAAELVAVTGRHWRVKRALPSPAPKVTVVIPTRNAEALLRVSVGSLLARSTYPNFEIVVVNNRSDDAGTLKYFEEIKRAGVRVLDYDAPFNFSAVNNFAVRETGGDLLAFLNNDLEVIAPDWLEEMAAQAIRPEIGCVGAMLYYPDDTVQHAGAVLGLTGPAGKDGGGGPPHNPPPPRPGRPPHPPRRGGKE